MKSINQLITAVLADIQMLVIILASWMIVKISCPSFLEKLTDII